PGVFDTRARAFCRHRALSAVDLPALERPANATSRPPSGGSWRWVWAASRYVARSSGLGAAAMVIASHVAEGRFDRPCCRADNSGTYLEHCMRHARAYGIAAL